MKQQRVFEMWPKTNRKGEEFSIWSFFSFTLLGNQAHAESFVCAAHAAWHMEVVRTHTQQIIKEQIAKEELCEFDTHIKSANFLI